MITIRRGRLIHLVNCNKKVCIWHQTFSYISNNKIINISKLLDRIGDVSRKYNLANIYSNFETFDIKEIFNNNSPNNSGVQI